jgi:circadian clock protein KaiC
LVANEHRLPFEKGVILSGLPALDALVGGGIPRGTSTLLTGPAGAGKSSLAVRYLFAAAERGESAALYLFDEGLNTVRERSAQLGMDLAPHIEAGRIEVQQFDPAEISPGEFTSFVRRAVEQRNARVVVIDSLNGLLNSMTGEQQLLLQMHELCAFLNQRGIATFLVLAQAGLLGSNMTPPVDISYLADNVILLRYFEAAGEVRKAVSVLKKRSGVHERAIRELRLQEGGIEVGEPLTAFHGVLTGVPSFNGSSSALEGALDGKPRS